MISSLSIAEWHNARVSKHFVELALLGDVNVFARQIQRYKCVNELHLEVFMFLWATFGDLNGCVDGQHSKKKMCSSVKFCEVNALVGLI